MRKRLLIRIVIHNTTGFSVELSIIRMESELYNILIRSSQTVHKVLEGTQRTNECKRTSYRF